MVRSAMAPVAGSFRDPAGYVFVEDGVYKRAILPGGLRDFRQFVESGLYQELSGARLVLSHEEENPRDEAVVIVPEQIPFISYPYEWSFSQMKDAALLTLDIQKRALLRGMCLKDASAYNVQFRGSKPVFIDTLSFEENRRGPWDAYDQFCRHFLGPLLLMANRWDIFNRLMVAMPDGVPLPVTSRLLPKRTWLRPGTLMHIHLHARAQSRRRVSFHATKAPVDRKAELADSLYAAIENLQAPKSRSGWVGYYDTRTHYTSAGEAFRRHFVARTILEHRPSLVFDLGANRGDYSRLTVELGFPCVSIEADAECAEAAYLEAKRLNSDVLLPLCMDLSSPTPSIGFQARERMAFHERPRASMLIALALIHHLRIAAMAPLENISQMFAGMGDRLIVEFVPKDDPMVRTMLEHRRDVFEDYTLEQFTRTFARLWDLEAIENIPESPRTLCVFRNRSHSGAQPDQTSQ